MSHLLLEFAAEHGLATLFVASFLASTLIPLGSEWLLVTLLLQGGSPTPLVLTATLGNTAGAFVTYLLGYYAQQLWRGRHKDNPRLDRACARFRHYGGGVLLFSWLPVVGDPLCLAAGLLRYRRWPFLLFTGAGKCARYAFVAWVTHHSGSLF